MTAVHVRRDGLDDDRRGDLVFAGDLVVFSAVPGLDAFRERTDELVRAVFGTDPQTAQFAVADDEYRIRIEEARKQVRADPVAHQLLLTALENTGVSAAGTYWDWVHLRILPHGQEHATAGTGWHRDTWASNLGAQTNWWTPIYPLTADRTITFAPTRWAEPIPNSSPDWDPQRARTQPDDPAAGEPRAPLIPEPLVPLSGIGELRVVVEPGDLLCFSGAHLHGTVPNTSGLARVSVELRTVHQTDLDRGRGAPNIDGHASRTRYRWFRHAQHNTRLAIRS